MGCDVVLNPAGWPGKSFSPASGKDVWGFGGLFLFKLLILLVFSAVISNPPCTLGLATSQDKKRNHSFAESLLKSFTAKYEEPVIACSLEGKIMIDAFTEKKQ